jgi:solute carrier family 10 (sodium/bile acid cotransporter), member 7
MRQWMARNPLQLLLWGALALALAYPNLGRSGTIWHPEHLVSLGVSVMFFMHGLALPARELWHGVRDWRLHIVIQLCTFAVFPLLGFAILVGGGVILDTPVRLGFFVLCATSSTIATAVALTGQSNGRVGLALFNASLSSVLGVLLTPLLAGLVAAQAGLTIAWLPTIEQIFLKVLLPLALGQTLRYLWGSGHTKLSRHTALVDYASIALTVFNALCDSVSQGAFSHSGVGELVMITLTASVLFWLIVFGLKLLCRAFGVNQADQIAVVFCGSQKSIANGLPIAKIVFAGSANLGLMILPLVIYHQFQLIYSSLLVNGFIKIAASDSGDAAR